ncbi:MAG TPA: hypothetical protein DCW83_08175 [Saprospirales bacterium]|jgi:hypothetical protein|nr:hypothetical protein [Saprospirales bacterium]|tara:strand:- start:440 stop:631 length:192 start_codon:yes stop_codon:yes gene_type:complete
MAKLSAYDAERVNHINHLMKSINDSSDDIYENLVDRDFLETKKSLAKLISQLKSIEESIGDDI